MAKRSIDPSKLGTGAALTRQGGTVKRIEGPNYNGQTPTNIRAGAKIASAGMKSKPYKFTPSDTPSAAGAKAYSKASPVSIKKAQRKVKRGK